jgi:adenylate kinase
MILMMGPPGAGKSVQGGLLGATIGYISISTGVLLRAKAAADTDMKDRMLKGELVNDDLVKELVTDIMRQHQPLGAVILDGFPRNVHQAAWLVETARDENTCIECMLHITADLGVVKKRLLERGRPDDEESIIVNRYREYQEISGPIIEAMVADHIPVMTVDGSQSIETVHQLVMAQIRYRRTC